MMTWRPTPIRQDEATRDTDQHQETPAAPPASLEPADQPPAQASSRRGGFGDTIKRLFREVKAALTGKEPEPEPKPRRKRGSGEAGRAFRVLVKKIVRRTARAPMVFPIDGFLWGTYDSFNPYWDFQDGAAQNHCAEHNYPEHENLSLH